LNAPFFKVGILPLDQDFSARFQRTAQIVVTISTNSVDRNISLLTRTRSQRFQSSVQIVADRNLEILNGLDVLEFLNGSQARHALTKLTSQRMTCFMFDASKKLNAFLFDAQTETLEIHTN
jgi:alkyl hydroperoxide reductase subunit AhpC